MKLTRAILLCLVLFSSQATALDVTVSWVNATQNTDGSAIPATGDLALQDTEVQWGTCGATAGTFGAAAGTALALPTATSHQVPGLLAGTHCFRARHQNVAGQFSNWSAVGQKVIAPVKPKPPTGLAVS